MPESNSASKTSTQPRMNPAYTPFPGQFHIWTYGSYYLSAPDGGARADDTSIQTEIHYAPGRMIGDSSGSLKWGIAPMLSRLLMDTFSGSPSQDRVPKGCFRPTSA